MLKLIIGIFWTAITYSYLSKSPLMIIVFLIAAIAFQVAYARSLHSFLEGDDPVAEYGSRNLKELSEILEIPFLIKILDILAKSFAYSFVMTILIYFEIL